MRYHCAKPALIGDRWSLNRRQGISRVRKRELVHVFAFFIFSPWTSVDIWWTTPLLHSSGDRVRWVTSKENSNGRLKDWERSGPRKKKIHVHAFLENKLMGFSVSMCVITWTILAASLRPGNFGMFTPPTSMPGRCRMHDDVRTRAISSKSVSGNLQYRVFLSGYSRTHNRASSPFLHCQVVASPNSEQCDPRTYVLNSTSYRRRYALIQSWK